MRLKSPVFPGCHRDCIFTPNLLTNSGRMWLLKCARAANRSALAFTTTILRPVSPRTRSIDGLARRRWLKCCRCCRVCQAGSGTRPSCLITARRFLFHTDKLGASPAMGDASLWPNHTTIVSMHNQMPPVRSPGYAQRQAAFVLWLPEFHRDRFCLRHPATSALPLAVRFTTVSGVGRYLQLPTPPDGHSTNAHSWGIVVPADFAQRVGVTRKASALDGP